jgi:hypothetical protein
VSRSLRVCWALAALAALLAPCRAEWITRFSDTVHLWRTDLNGQFGTLNDGATDLTLTPEGTLRVRVSFPGPEGVGGAWFCLRGHPSSAHVTLDLSRWRAIGFRVRGRLLDVGEERPVGTLVARVELKDASRAWDRTVSHGLTLAPAETWSTVTIPADVSDRAVWQANGTPPDPRALKELVFVLDGADNPAGALLELDDLALEGPASEGEPLTDDRLLEEASHAAFRYFWDYAHPQLGLALDQSASADTYTIAGTGFGLAAWCVGAERGWVTRAEAVERTRRLLQFLASAPMGPEPRGTVGYRGLYYHFLGPDGLRLGGSELSTIDTALLLWGVLCAEGYYDGPNEGDIRALARRIVDGADWRWMLAPDGLIYHGWMPEDGGRFLGGRWDCYTDEALLVTLLAVGTGGGQGVPPDALWHWARVRVTPPTGESFVASYPGAMFTYFFASVWLSTEALDREDAHPSAPVDWWANSAAAARANIAYCASHPELYGGAGWGLTACEGVAGGQSVYHAYGAPPALEIRDGRLVQRDSPHPVAVSDGTGETRYLDESTVLAVYGAAGAMCFAPDEALRALRAYRERYDLWRSADCGYADAFAPSTGWVGRSNYAIDAGPLLLAIDNYRALREGRLSTTWRSVAATETARRAVEALHGGRHQAGAGVP